MDEVQLVYEADWVTELTQGNLQRVQGLGLVVIQNFPHICIYKLQISNSYTKIDVCLLPYGQNPTENTTFFIVTIVCYCEIVGLKYFPIVANLHYSHRAGKPRY